MSISWGADFGISLRSNRLSRTTSPDTRKKTQDAYILRANHLCVIGTIHAQREANFEARLASDVVEAAAFSGLRPLIHQSGQEAVIASGPTPMIERFESVTSTKAHESFKRAAPSRTCKTTRLGV